MSIPIHHRHDSPDASPLSQDDHYNDDDGSSINRDPSLNNGAADNDADAGTSSLQSLTQMSATQDLSESLEEEVEEHEIEDQQQEEENVTTKSTNTKPAATASSTIPFTPYRSFPLSTFRSLPAIRSYSPLGRTSEYHPRLNPYAYRGRTTVEMDDGDDEDEDEKRIFDADEDSADPDSLAEYEERARRAMRDLEDEVHASKPKRSRRYEWRGPKQHAEESMEDDEEKEEQKYNSYPHEDHTTAAAASSRAATAKPAKSAHQPPRQRHHQMHDQREEKKPYEERHHDDNSQFDFDAASDTHSQQSSTSPPTHLNYAQRRLLHLTRVWRREEALELLNRRRILAAQLHEHEKRLRQEEERQQANLARARQLAELEERRREEERIREEKAMQIRIQQKIRQMQLEQEEQMMHQQREQQLRDDAFAAVHDPQHPNYVNPSELHPKQYHRTPFSHPQKSAVPSEAHDESDPADMSDSDLYRYRSHILVGGDSLPPNALMDVGVRNEIQHDQAPLSHASPQSFAQPTAVVNAPIIHQYSDAQPQEYDQTQHQQQYSFQPINQADLYSSHESEPPMNQGYQQQQQHLPTRFLPPQLHQYPASSFQPAYALQQQHITYGLTSVPPNHLPLPFNHSQLANIAPHHHTTTTRSQHDAHLWSSKFSRLLQRSDEQDEQDRLDEETEKRRKMREKVDAMKVDNIRLKERLQKELHAFNEEEANNLVAATSSSIRQATSLAKAAHEQHRQNYTVAADEHDRVRTESLLQTHRLTAHKHRMQREADEKARRDAIDRNTKEKTWRLYQEAQERYRKDTMKSTPDLMYEEKEAM